MAKLLQIDDRIFNVDQIVSMKFAENSPDGTPTLVIYLAQSAGNGIIKAEGDEARLLFDAIDNEVGIRIVVAPPSPSGSSTRDDHSPDVQARLDGRD